MKRIELSPGQSLSERLTYIEEAGFRSNQKLVKCLCSCGNTTVTGLSRIRTGHTKSCGCYADISRVESNIKHGKARKNKKTPEYTTWESIIRRCYMPSQNAYKHYGGKGIQVCDRWRNSFESFLEDMGEKPDLKLTIERRDSNKDYSPDNCYWATRKQQALNTSRNLELISYAGFSKPLVDWSELLGVRYHLLYKRLFLLGWSLERTFTTHPCNVNEALAKV